MCVCVCMCVCVDWMSRFHQNMHKKKLPVFLDRMNI